MKWISLLLAVTVFLALIILVSPAAGGLLAPPASTATRFAVATPTLAATATPSPSATPKPTATPSPSPTPSPTATAAPPTPTPRPPVSSDVAERTVREFFQAVGAKDYAGMQDRTSGDGRRVADTIIAEVSRNEQEHGVTLQPRVSRLDVLAVEPREGATAVRTAYVVDILAQVGPFQVPSRTLAGEATFIVANVEGRPLITGVEGDLAY